MIQPITPEPSWNAKLSRLPVWHPPTGRIVFVSPHPDDEVLAAGGFLAAQRSKGVDITVVAVTDGENAYGRCDRLGAIRVLEQAAALARLGIPCEKIVRLRLIDSAVQASETLLTQSLLSFVDADTHLVAPWSGDFHPDHEACGRAAETVAKRTGARLSSYFFWTWHRAEVNAIEQLHLSLFLLDDELLAAKTEALAFHCSQLIRECGDPILPECLLAPARRPFEVFATS
jgi:LmbE family N-acetylglucosaminyl deacetylase